MQKVRTLPNISASYIFKGLLSASLIVISSSNLFTKEGHVIIVSILLSTGCEIVEHFIGEAPFCEILIMKVPT